MIVGFRKISDQPKMGESGQTLIMYNNQVGFCNVRNVCYVLMMLHASSVVKHGRFYTANFHVIDLFVYRATYFSISFDIDN